MGHGYELNRLARPQMENEARGHAARRGVGLAQGCSEPRTNSAMQFAYARARLAPEDAERSAHLDTCKHLDDPEPAPLPKGEPKLVTVIRGLIAHGSFSGHGGLRALRDAYAALRPYETEPEAVAVFLEE